MSWATSQGYGMAEIERRCRELGERERAKGLGVDPTVRVRFVEPRPKPRRVPKPKPVLTPVEEMRPKEPKPRRAPRAVRGSRVSGPPTGRRGRVWAWLLTNGPATTNQIAVGLGFDVQYVGVCLNKLAKRGLVERTGRKVWSGNSPGHTEWQAHPPAGRT